MKHAGPETLGELEPLLSGVRGLSGVVEKRPGVFYRRSHALLHFHEDPTGPYADVRLGADWERHRVATAEEQGQLFEMIRRAVAGG